MAIKCHRLDNQILLKEFCPFLKLQSNELQWKGSLHNEWDTEISQNDKNYNLLNVCNNFPKLYMFI